MVVWSGIGMCNMIPYSRLGYTNIIRFEKTFIMRLFVIQKFSKNVRESEISEFVLVG